jgi:ornithine cyclodeaminase/alanine dehydrogenase-like protein (mu-crystallin family)
MKIFDAAQTRAALGFEALVPALRQMFERGCEMPARHVHTVPGSSGDMTVLVMPAWQAGRYFGLKTINIAPANATRGLPGLHATYLLHDADTGVPLAFIDGSELTACRTAATSALGASFMARPDARRLLVVGAGRVAQHLPAAYRSVLPIEEVQVWARRPDAAEALAAQWHAQGLPARAAPDLPAAVAWADAVSCATLSTQPVVQGAWLRPGTHLDLIGSFTPDMREADDACFRAARVAVDDAEAWRKSGELLGPVSRGVLAPQGPTLATLCRGEAAGRTDVQERTVFKSVGCALEDLAAAVLVYEGSGGSRR